MEPASPHQGPVRLVSNLAIAGLVTAGVFAVIDWYAVTRADARLERIAKPAVMGTLIVTVLLSDPGASTRSLLLALALGASLTGDLLLLPPERFTYGLVAFFFAHVAYLALFLLGPLHAEPAALGAIGAAIVFLVVGRGIFSGASRAGLRGPVAGYLAAIFLMAIAATARGSVPAALGAWLFVASDAMLGWDRFVARPPALPRAALLRRLGVIVTYHGAQLLLAAAILGAA